MANNFKDYSKIFAAITLASGAIIMATGYGKSFPVYFNNMLSGLFFFVAGLATFLIAYYREWRSGYSIAAAWLIISISTAYLAIAVSPYVTDTLLVKVIDLSLGAIVTLVWVILLVIAKLENKSLLNVSVDD